MNWSEDIRELRFRLNLKQDELARQLGVSQASISQWERGVTEPPRRVLAQLRDLMSRLDRATGDAALEASVRSSPNLCGLLRREGRRVILELQSDAGFKLFPGFIRTDLGNCIRGKLGDQVDETYDKLMDIGAFEGRIRSAVVHSKARYDGQEFIGISTYTPFLRQNGQWVLRAEVRLAPPDDPVVSDIQTWPHYVIDGETGRL